MLKGTIILVLAYVATVYCAATPQAETELYGDPGPCGNMHGGHNLC